jgi:hypothetical protein
MVTYKQMCETIVESSMFPGKTAKEIFEYSPTGELFNISVWYTMALNKLSRPKESQRYPTYAEFAELHNYFGLPKEYVLGTLQADMERGDAAK